MRIRCVRPRGKDGHVPTVVARHDGRAAHAQAHVERAAKHGHRRGEAEIGFTGMRAGNAVHSLDKARAWLHPADSRPEIDKGRKAYPDIAIVSVKEQRVVSQGLVVAATGEQPGCAAAA